MAPATTSSTAGSQAVDRAAALVALVVESDGPRTFTSLVDELGLPRSTTSRLLLALERARLVHRDAAGHFRPGALFALYAAGPDATADLAALAAPTLERLGELTGETVNLAVARGDTIVQIAQVDSQFLLGATNWVGVDVPSHCSALGKALLAADGMALPSGPLESRTDASITTRAALDRELTDVRRRGYAVAWEELEPGLVAVAAAVREQGPAVAALSVSGPTARLTRSRVTAIGKLLVTEADALSQLLHARTNFPRTPPAVRSTPKAPARVPRTSTKEGAA